MPQAQQENQRLYGALVLFILWMLLHQDSGSSLLAASFTGNSRLTRQREAHRVLNTTKWGDLNPQPLADDPLGDKPRFLNLTGFRERDGYVWDDLPTFRDLCREWSRRTHPPPENSPDEWLHVPAKGTWLNATGTVHGEWVRKAGSVLKHPENYNLTAIAPGIDWPRDNSVEWGRNITGSHGTILLRLEEDEADMLQEDETVNNRMLSASQAREISARATFQDEGNPAPSWTMRLHGVHWPIQGSILMTTTSEKFAGIFGLPHLAPSPHFFQSSQKLLNQTIQKVLKEKERSRFVDPGNPWTSVVDEAEDPWGSSPQCEYVVYLQLFPLDLNDQPAGSDRDSVIDALEHELRFPSGAPTRETPDLRMSFVAWSPDCSYYLESKWTPLQPSPHGQHLIGAKEEIFIYRAKVWLSGFALVLMSQVWLLKAQMKESCTPSTIGRVSFYTASMMLLVDGLIFAAASAWSLSAENTFLPCLLVTFAAFMSMVIGGTFVADVYRIQEPERRSREREQTTAASRTPPRAATTAAPTAAPAAAATTTTAPGALPLPVTARPPPPSPPPIIIPSDQDIDAEIAANTTGATAVANTTRPRPQVSTFASITGHFVLVGIFVILLTAASSSWPTHLRAAYINTICFIYLSLWVPQIWRNVQRNSRRAFAWRFMIGQSALRLMPIAYFYLREDNFLFADPDWPAFAMLVGWVWVQLWVLAFQDVLGPRFGLPKGWMPEAWDYHPVLREDAVEAGGLPIGLMGGSGDSRSEPGSPVVFEGSRRESWSAVSQHARHDHNGDEGDGLLRRENDKEREKRGMMMRSIDCAICREVLEVPVVRAGSDGDDSSGSSRGGGGLADMLARRAYMVTPCRHIFHTKCLEGWLRFRLQCPICREELPPL